MLIGYALFIWVPDHQAWFSFLLVFLFITVIVTAENATKGGTAMLLHGLAGGYFVNLTSDLVTGA